MDKITFKYLSQEAILDLDISFDTVIEAIERVMVSHARDLCECPPKPGVFPRNKSFLHAMPAYIRDLDICGIKWVSGYPANREKNLPVICGVLVLNNPDTGIPLAVMDCRWITAVRTASVAAITAKYCSLANAETMTMIGTGEQAKWNLLLIKKVIPGLKECYLQDISSLSLERFIQSMQDRVPDVILKPIKAKNLKAAIEKSQIAVTATQNLSEPIITQEMIHPGLLGMALEGKAWEDIIYTEVLDRFVCDDWNLVKSYQKKGSFQLGLPKAYHLLGDIIDGKAPGRTDDSEFVMSFNMGLAISDVVLGSLIHEEAQKRSIGIDLTLMAEENIMR